VERRQMSAPLEGASRILTDAVDTAGAPLSFFFFFTSLAFLKF